MRYTLQLFIDGDMMTTIHMIQKNKAKMKIDL